MIDRTVPILVDDGQPFVLWSPERPGMKKEGFVVDTQVCDNPACPCREVTLRVWGIDERFIRIKHQGNAMQFQFLPDPDEPRKMPEARLLAARYDIDTGRCELDPQAPPECRNPHLLVSFTALLDGQTRQRLRKRWDAVKGTNRERWRSADWSWWKPGDQVSWAEFQPDDPHFTFRHDGASYWASDLYCIDPACSCRSMTFSFFPVSAKSVTTLGAVRVSLPGLACEVALPEGGRAGEDQLKKWNATLIEEYGLATLKKEAKRRAKEIKQLGAMLLGTTPASAAAPASGRTVGRNEPCPCGSGRKFKHCCMG